MYGIKDNKCFEQISGTPYSVVLTQNSDITTDSSTWWRNVFMPESSHATGDVTLIPDEYFPYSAVTVTPIIHDFPSDPIGGAITAVPFVVNDVEGVQDQIVVVIAHSSVNTTTIPAGTQYLVTFTTA